MFRRQLRWSEAPRAREGFRKYTKLCNPPPYQIFGPRRLRQTAHPAETGYLLPYASASRSPRSCSLSSSFHGVYGVERSNRIDLTRQLDVPGSISNGYWPLMDQDMGEGEESQGGQGDTSGSVTELSLAVSATEIACQVVLQ